MQHAGQRRLWGWGSSRMMRKTKCCTMGVCAPVNATQFDQGCICMRRVACVPDVVLVFLHRSCLQSFGQGNISIVSPTAVMIIGPIPITVEVNNGSTGEYGEHTFVASLPQPGM